MVKPPFSSSHKHIKNMRRDPFAELQVAISNLEQFARRKKSSSLSDVILPIFSSKAKVNLENKKASVRNVVLQAIKTIKSHHLFIEKLKKGNDDDKKLADSIHQAIKQYHAALDEPHDSPNEWSDRITKFFLGSSLAQDLKPYRINLPNLTSVQWLHLQNDKADARIQLAFNANICFTTDLLQDPLLAKEGDALRMKASTLIRQHGIVFKNIAETLSSVRNAPIRATYDPHSETSTLYLKLDVLPGTVIKVQGSFKRDIQDSSVPIAESFKLSLENTQTGFPFPIQYTGWSVNSSLIPTYPYELDQMTIFKSIYEARVSTALMLQPNGTLINHAKQLIELKKKVMSRNVLELCEMHKTLVLAFIENSLLDINFNKEEAKLVVEKYFNLIKDLPNALEYVAEAYQVMNHNFVETPFAKLQEACHEKSNDGLFHNDVNVIQNAAFAFLDGEFEQVFQSLCKEQENSATDLMFYMIEFEKCLAKVLTPSFYAILLQNLSETLRCAPPMLDDFSQKIQLSVYTQFYCFQEDLNSDLSKLEDAEAFIENKLKERLKNDIALFQAQSFESTEHLLIPLVEELEDYFNACYYSLLEE